MTSIKKHPDKQPNSDELAIRYHAMLQEVLDWLEPESGSHFPHRCKEMRLKIKKMLT